MDAIARQVTDALLAAGADHAQVRATTSVKQELNAEWDEISLLRSTSDRGLVLTAIVGGKQATLAVNDLSEAALDQAVADVLAQAQASRPDEANAIPEGVAPAAFAAGSAEPDLDKMYARLEEFIEWRRARYPKAALRGVHFDFVREQVSLSNSSGLALESQTGVYQFVAMFSSKQGADVSSFNYTAWRGRDLARPLSEVGSFDRLIRQSEEQLHTERVPEKFVGDLIVTPDCLRSFLEPALGYVRDGALIAGDSVYQEALGTPIASELLTIHARPRTTSASPRFFTGDGFVSEDMTLVERGILRSYLLSLYGANKTGRARAANDGMGNFVVETGDTPLDEMIASIDRGVLLCRFSGGRPSKNGDFSGIAKNSYYIEGGKIKAPISETMVSGNLVAFLKNITAVSQEDVDFGFARFPWVQVSDITVS